MCRETAAEHGFPYIGRISQIGVFVKMLAESFPQNAVIFPVVPCRFRKQAKKDTPQHGEMSLVIISVMPVLRFLQ